MPSKIFCKTKVSLLWMGLSLENSVKQSRTLGFLICILNVFIGKLINEKGTFISWHILKGEFPCLSEPFGGNIVYLIVIDHSLQLSFKMGLSTILTISFSVVFIYLFEKETFVYIEHFPSGFRSAK